jgi:hypothetical protein
LLYSGCLACPPLPPRAPWPPLFSAAALLHFVTPFASDHRPRCHHKERCPITYAPAAISWRAFSTSSLACLAFFAAATRSAPSASRPRGLAVARIAGVAAFVNMAGERGSARIAGAPAFVSTGGKGAVARIAWAAAFVSTAGESGDARIAGAAAFVSMACERGIARIAGAAAFVSTAG